MVGVILIIVLVGLGVAVMFTVSSSKRPCPYCRTMMPKNSERCPHCRRAISTGY